MNGQKSKDANRIDEYADDFTESSDQQEIKDINLLPEYIDSLTEYIQSIAAPLTTFNLVVYTVNEWPNVIPVPLYDPRETYQKDQKIFHASPLLNQWFVIQNVDGPYIDVRFDDGTEGTYIHQRVNEITKEFPTTPEEYFLEIISKIILSKSHIYHHDNLWHHQPIPIKEEKPKQKKQITKIISKETAKISTPTKEEKTKVSIPITEERTKKEVPIQTKYTDIPFAASRHKTELLSTQPSLFDKQHPTEKTSVSTSHSKIIEEKCRNMNIFFLFHITRIENLPGIFQGGLLCKNKVNICIDISNQEIQQHRHFKKIPFYPEHTLHDCVPLFFAPLSPMLSAIREQQRDIVYLFIDPMVLSLPEATFTDGNARNNPTKFYMNIEDLDQLDWEILRADYWFCEDPMLRDEVKRKRSAEVLVPHNISSRYIRKIGVINTSIRDRVKGMLVETGVHLPILVIPNFYFSNTSYDNLSIQSETSSTQTKSELDKTPKPPPNFELDDPLIN